jgi:DNA-binding transcriptional LysR family regulator
MTFDQLRIFVAVAEREHMTRAAELLGLTQSGVSAAIAALELRYDTPLFHRVGRGVELTEAGKSFLPEAKAVLNRVTAAELSLSELGGLKRGVLSVYASQTIASYWLPKYLVRFSETYPDIQVRLEVGNTAQVAKAVHNGTVELGFVEGAVEDSILAQEPIAGDCLVLVVGSGHPWASRKKLDPQELSQSKWVLRELGSGTRSEFAAALKQLGINIETLNIVLELPSNEAVRAAVEAGAGATAISELLVDSGIKSSVLYRVPMNLPKRQFIVLGHRERSRSKVAAAFLALINSDRVVSVPFLTGNNRDNRR